jgi:hypothetical protein
MNKDRIVITVFFKVFLRPQFTIHHPSSQYDPIEDKEISQNPHLKNTDINHVVNEN